jgi:hypothetical protein
VAPPAPTRSLLASLAADGAAILIDDLSAGMFSRVVVLARVQAPVEAVRAVIANPERYGEHTRVIRDIRIDSRRGPRVGFRFQAHASIFTIETCASLRVVNPRRMDVAIVRSDLGPGAARWELFDDGPDATLVSLTAWGDPSRGHWLFRQVASRSVTAIPLMTAGVSLLLSLSLLSAVRQRVSASPPTSPRPLEPLSADAIRAAPRGGVLGAARLEPDGRVRQASVALEVPAPIEALRGWLQDPTRYPQVWRAVRQVRVLSRSEREITFASVLETPMARSSGTRTLTLAGGNDEMTAHWRGVDGDERGLDLRWDLRRIAPDRTSLSATVNDQTARLGFPLRGTVEQEPGLRAGFAFGLAVAWARALARRASPEPPLVVAGS